MSSSAVDKLYNDRRVRLWVVYVDTFSGQDAVSWAERPGASSDFGDQDAILAVATQDRAYAFLAPTAIVSDSDVRRHCAATRSNPLCAQSDWAGAAVAAADGLNPASVDRDAESRGSACSSRSAVIVVARAAAVAVDAAAAPQAPRSRVRRRAPRGSGRPQRAGRRCRSTRSTTCPSRSSSMSTTPCAPATTNWRLAVEEFGDEDTAPFSQAVADAKTTLAQAFNVRQILDDAIPETPAQRRDLLTRVIVAAAQGRPRTRRAARSVRAAARPGHQRARPGWTR